MGVASHRSHVMVLLHHRHEWLESAPCVDSLPLLWMRRKPGKKLHVIIAKAESPETVMSSLYV